MTVSCALFTVLLEKDQWFIALVNFIWQHLIECFFIFFLQKFLFATLSYWDHLVHLKIYSRDLPDFLRDLELGHWPDWVLIHCEYWTTFVATICMTSFCCYPLSHSCCQGSNKEIFKIVKNICLIPRVGNKWRLLTCPTNMTSRNFTKSHDVINRRKSR